MAGAQERMMELALQGMGCSQLLVQLALEAEGKESPDLLRAVAGLHGGLGFTGKVCGALSAGCCVLALRGGRESTAPGQDVELEAMIRSLVGWFEEEYGPRYGGSDCAAILAGDPRNRLTRCPEIVAAVHGKIEELLDQRS